jgi:hypothetical protein
MPTSKVVELSANHRRAVNYYLMGMTKRAAAKKAGFSPQTARDVFTRLDVRQEIERRVKLSEQKTDIDRDWLLRKLRTIIESSPGELIEVDKKGRPSLNWNLLSPELRSVVSKVTVDTDRPGGKYKHQKSHVQLQTPDVIAAIREAGKLLGLYEQKTKLDIDENLIEILTRRRNQLAGDEDDKEEK